MELTQEEKAALLQRAVINSSVEELTKIYGELGFVEMSAPALGLACRFRGLDLVKCLVKEGASFEELENLTIGGLRKAVMEGDADRGSVMAGQIAGLIKKEQSCKEIIDELMAETIGIVKERSSWVR